jgi:nickel-dependent lactate racemase
MKKLHLQYGTEGIELATDAPNLTVLEPKFVPGLPDERKAFAGAVRPLRDLIRAGDRTAIVIPDLTRPLPSERLLPWLFEELAHVPAENFVIVNGTGTHRPNTREELERMVGAGVVAKYTLVNHDAQDDATHEEAGKAKDGRPVRLNRAYVQADKRIVMGFIEPHFMAGYSGGLKGIFPAIADMQSIMHYHNAEIIGDPRSTWARLEDNPTQQIIRHNGGLVPPDFCINVTLNRKREITGYYCGADTIEAHRRGAEACRAVAMAPCKQPFPIIVTTNSGYPLDQNLYQTVKGMSAAAQVVARGGTILTVSRCNAGFPAEGNFKKLLFDHDSPQALLDTINAPGFLMHDQWEAQLLALICLKARVGLFSELPADEVRRAYLEPVEDVSARLAAELGRVGRDVPVAVLPEGPMTIPCLTG